MLALANDAAKVLTPIARTDKNQNVRLRAIAGLAKNQDIGPWKELLGQFYGETPVVQRAVIDGMFASVPRTGLLLDEIAAGRIKPAVVDPIHAELLLKHKDAGDREAGEENPGFLRAGRSGEGAGQVSAGAEDGR